ncbi:MAG: DNA repair protein RecN [Blautia sp.]|nr:DNA repair protein RecN [Blautia sp.]
MLQNLHVKNLALIDEAEVEFTEGLNILSGETGAGKSIIIGSIGLALGEKASRGLLPEDEDTAFVELIFSVEDKDTLEAVRSLGIPMEDDTIILNRKITSGRTVARINGEAVPASKLKAVAALLIDIHGQHEHQSLLHRKKHLEILDAYAREQLSDRPKRLAACYQDYRKLKEEWESSKMDTEERTRELSFLEYEVKELSDASLRPGEDEELEQLFRKYENGRRLMDAVNAAHSAVGGEGESATGLLGRAIRELSAVSEYDKRVEDMQNQLMEIDDLMADFNHEAAAYLSEEEFDEKTYYETEKRLDLINHLKSKYGSTIEEILAAYEKKQQRIVVLKDYDEYLNQLSTSLKEKQKELDALCGEVSAIRRRESGGLCAAIREALCDLNFLEVEFAMSFTRTDYTAGGTDEAEFYISTNPGEPQKPLAQVASGGELSRIMLAIKTVMADADAIETLIFDEIDSGISGRTAQMVAEKMSYLAKNHQMICITHLPQIAAMADSHFLIEKSVEQQSTVSRIRRLDEENSVEELARMLGGVEITDTVRQNAREMRAMAHMKK